jgi:predicted phage tail protein
MLWDRLHALAERIQSFFEALIGAALVSLPFWNHLVADLTAGFQLVAAACGAVIGLHGVWKIWSRYRRPARLDGPT